MTLNQPRLRDTDNFHRPLARTRDRRLRGSLRTLLVAMSSSATAAAYNGVDEQADDHTEDQSEAEEEINVTDINATAADETGGDRTTLQNGKPYAISDAPTDYSLFSNPPNLGRMRQRLFEIGEPIEVSQDEFDAYFPFVDNIWRKLRTGEPQKERSARVEFYSCRLRKGANPKPHIPKPTPEGKQSRKKRIRDDKTCGMTIKVVYHEGTKTCTVARAVDREQRHTHDLDYIDATKRNTGIMDTARREAIRGFLPASIFWKMWEEPDKMEEAGGKFMKVSDVRNVQYPWRQENLSAVLKAHSGFSQARATPRARPPSPPKAFQQAPLIQPGPQPVPAPRHMLPVSPLQYPEQARGFLAPYLPDPRLSSHPGRPHITLTWASSLDSRISLMPGTRTAISGPETKAMTHYLRSRHDAILIGVQTAIADDPSLNCRLAGSGGYGAVGLEYQPRPIIIDPHARLHIQPEMNVLKVAAQGRAKAPWVVVAPGAMLHPQAVSILKAHGGEYLMIHDYHPHADGLNWEGVFNVLFREGIKSVMVEGGGVVLSQLLKTRYAHLIDSVVMTIAPTFFGKAGVCVSPDPTFDDQGIPMATRLTDVRWQPMGDADVVMCGRMRYEPQTNGVLPRIEELTQAAGDGPVRPQRPARANSATTSHVPPPAAT